jgi:transposase-like protein
MARMLENSKKSKRSRPTKSKRKRTLNSWEPDRMAQAMNEFVEGKLSLRQISRAWGIPKSTLQRRVTG